MIIYSLVLLILLLLQGLFIRYWYVRTLNDVGTNAMNISIALAKAINVDEYDTLITDQERNTYFTQIQDYFQRVQKTTGVKYVYVEHKISDTQIEYIFDSEKDSFGERDVISTPTAHTSPQSFHTSVEASTIWGTLITGYSPLINKEGKIVGSVGTDIDVSFFYHELLDSLLSILLYAGGMIVLFGFLIYITLRQEINERKAAQEKLTESTYALRNLLNNAGQGFLAFEGDLQIGTEYSKECEKLFGHELINQLFPEVMFPKDHQQREFLTEILRDILQETNDVKRAILLTLLPEEIILNDRCIHLDFRLIQTSSNKASNTIMVILSDITDKRSLESQMEDDRKTLKMIVHFITDRNSFIMCIDDYKSFCKLKLPQILASTAPLQEMIFECFRHVHTYKGNFSQFEMPHITEKLQNMENKLNELRKREKGNDGPAVTEARSRLLALMSQTVLLDWLDQELNILHDTLGDGFLSPDNIVIVDESKLIELEERIQRIFPSVEGQSLIIEIQKLRYKPFNELLKPYQTYVVTLSDQLEKRINPMVIEGEEIRVNLSQYHTFARTLVHVFRNALDHGIESVDERVDQGKLEYGQIKCLVEREGNSLVLTIGDDGRGINYNALREKAIEKGILDHKTAYQQEDEKILQYIFYDDFSTNDMEDEFSGRGMGLSAVKHELDHLGGSIKVTTAMHEGTTFYFSLPIRNT